MTTTPITIEHVVVASNRSYEEVCASLEAQLGPKPDLDKFQEDLKTTSPSWEQVAQILEQLPGTSGLVLFEKFDFCSLLTLKGKPAQAVGYVIGNALLAIQMLEHAPEAALYAPFRLAVYEGAAGTTFVAYDRFASQLAQYSNPAIASVAQLVSEKQEALVAEAVGRGEQLSSVSRDNGDQICAGGGPHHAPYGIGLSALVWSLRRGGGSPARRGPGEPAHWFR